MFLTIMLWAVPWFSTHETVMVDQDLEPYRKVMGIAGNLTCVGSDTLNNLMVLWAEEFHKIYPSMNVQIEGKGSGTAPPALVQGVAELGAMSRPMKREEMDAFEARMGYRPTRIAVALDGLAVFVHIDNPLTTISLPQLDAIYSENRRGGFGENIRRWSQLGVSEPLGDYPVRAYGRNSASGTYGFFKQVALFKGDFKASVKEQPGSSSVVMSVTADPAGIGYAGVGYMTSGVKTLAIASKQSGPAHLPKAEQVLSGDYPLARMLYIYVIKAPGTALSKPVHEFLHFILSREGQRVVVRSGYIPLPAKVVERQFEVLGIDHPD